MSACPTCKTQMRALFTGEFCPNDCDRRPRATSFPTYMKSTLWVPAGLPGTWTLACPHCRRLLLRSHIDMAPNVNMMLCGGSPMHSVCVFDDENAATVVARP